MQFQLSLRVGLRKLTVLCLLFFLVCAEEKENYNMTDYTKDTSHVQPKQHLHHPLDGFFSSKRRVPNTSDPLHNRWGSKGYWEGHYKKLLVFSSLQWVVFSPPDLLFLLLLGGKKKKRGVSCFSSLYILITKAKATLCDCIMTSRGANATFVWLCVIPSVLLLVNSVLLC